MVLFVISAAVLLVASALRMPAPIARHPVCAMLAKQKLRKKKPTSAAAPARGFGAKGPSPAEESLTKAARKTMRAAAESSSAEPWLLLASSCAEVEEYAEARMVLEAGIAHCGAATGGEALIGALGQMRRVGPSPEVLTAGESLAWPGKGDESPYNPSRHSFRAFSSPAWPDDCPRGTMYPTGEKTVRLSETPILDPAECEWVVAQAEQAWSAAVGDFANEENIGSDMIWGKPFPDRLWLRDVPGLLPWFEHRLRTRLFPMLQPLYPEAIPRAAAGSKP